MSEIELAKKVVDWLKGQHWEIYQEVQFSFAGGVADIVAVSLGIVWIIECKNSYGLKVLNQASRWASHYRSVAVPRAKGYSRDYRVAKDYYRVGVIELSKFGDIDEPIKAPLLRINHRQSQKYLAALDELLKDYAPAGSQSGNHLTPYKRTMLEVKEFITKNPGCTVKDLYENLGEMHYANINSFKGNIMSALDCFEVWCFVDKSTKPRKLYIKCEYPAL